MSVVIALALCLLAFALACPQCGFCLQLSLFLLQLSNASFDIQIILGINGIADDSVAVRKCLEQLLKTSFWFC